MLADIFKQLGVNDTLWTQFAIFVVLFVILKFLYFAPFLRVIEARRQVTEGVEGDADETNAKAESKEAEYQRLLKEAKAQARSEYDQIVGKTSAAIHEDISHVKAEAKTKIEAARLEIDKEAKSAIESLGSEVSNISKLFLDKLMKAKVKL